MKEATIDQELKTFNRIPILNQEKTSIGISFRLKNFLDKCSVNKRETYEGIIWRLISESKANKDLAESLKKEVNIPKMNDIEKYEPEEELPK